jgi:8-oxo-dGTP pyrophosphatase MutT (NUDIX family)
VKTVRYRAAGGVVTAGGRVLVLLRPSRGEVRLPKGKIERGESARRAALREVTEESGYPDLDVVADLGSMQNEFDHVDADGSPMHVVRDERYFLMRLTSPKHEASGEEAEEFIADWQDPDDAIAALTYEPEREWVRRALLTDGGAGGRR